MKLKNRRLAAAFGLIVTFSASSSLPGQALTWDPSNTGGSDGGGTWDNSATNWWNGAANVAAAQGVNRNLSTTSGSTTVTGSTTGLVVGMGVSANSGIPAGATIATIIDANSFTISVPATENGGRDMVLGQNIVIGAGSGAAGTINLASAQQINSLTINAAGSGNYVFTGAALTLGRPSASLTVNSSATFQNVLNVQNANAGVPVTIAAGQTLTLANGGNVVASTFTGTATSTLAVTGGTTSASGGVINIGSASAKTGGYQIGGTATVTHGGGLQIATTSAGGFMSVSSGATLNIAGGGAGQLTIGRNGVTNVGRLLVNGGTVNITSTNAAPVFIGRGAGNGTLEVTGGAFNASAATQIILAADVNSTGLLDISGGTVRAAAIAFHGDNSLSGASAAGTGSGTIALSGTGSLYVGSGGIVSRQTDVGTVGNRSFINLSGGTLGADANWSSNLAINLVSGNTTIKAANEANSAYNITLSGTISGGGILTKTGGGTLTLSGANTYDGGTSISDGILVASSAGALGTGDINLGDATLSLDVANIIADTATLFFSADSLIELDYSGDDTVLAVTSTTTSQSIGAGTWTAAELNTFFGGNYFSGTGTLTTVIPEPSSMALLGLGVAGITLIRRRKAV